MAIDPHSENGFSAFRDSVLGMCITELMSQKCCYLGFPG